MRAHPFVIAARLAVALLAAAACAPAAPSTSSSAVASTTRVGPPAGSLVVAGGGTLDSAVLGRFIELAGGPDAPIVVIPTAGEDSTYPADWRGLNGLRAAGARNLRVLHTHDRSVADSPAFARAIDEARGVWFPGGRQWRLVDAYADTRTERALHALLARGGVVGGTSAGASIQSSYMVRGARSGNTIMMAPGYERGFGFLRDVAVDQHVLARGRVTDLAPVLARYPALLGIGIDEGTAIVVRGDRFDVIGRSTVYVHGGRDATPRDTAYLTLRAGDAYDMAARRRLPPGAGR